MKLLGELVHVRKPRLYIPWFQRVAPCLRSRTVLHGVLLPGGGNRRPELYLSPFPPGNWADVWQLQFEFVDRPGLLAELTALLGHPRVHVNILAHEVMTLRHEDEPVASINLIGDMTGYGGPDNPDGTTHDRRRDPDARLQYLLDYLTIEFARDLRFAAGRPQLFAARLRELQRVGARAEEEGLRPFAVPIDGGRIDLPDHEWEQLVHGSAPAAGGRYRMTLASDTEERYVKVTPLSADRDHVLLEILHQDWPGQVAGFTALLRSEFPAVQIVSGYLRLCRAGGPAVWRCLLEAEPGRPPDLPCRLGTAFARARERLGDPTLTVSIPRPLEEAAEPAWGLRYGLLARVASWLF